jgi:hypothetical protein
VTGEVPCGLRRGMLTVVRERQTATKMGPECREAVVAGLRRQSAVVTRVLGCVLLPAKQPACTVHISCDQLFLQRTGTGRGGYRDARPGQGAQFGRHGRVVVGRRRRRESECPSCRCSSRVEQHEGECGGCERTAVCHCRQTAECSARLLTATCTGWLQGKRVRPTLTMND